jgi:hypothetical protein
VISAVIEFLPKQTGGVILYHAPVQAPTQVESVEKLRRWVLVAVRITILVCMVPAVEQLMTGVYIGATGGSGSVVAMIPAAIRLGTLFVVACFSKRLAAWLVPAATAQMAGPWMLRGIIRAMLRAFVLFLAVWVMSDAIGQACWMLVRGAWTVQQLGQFRPLFSLMPLVLLYFTERRIAEWIVPELPRADLCPKCGYSLKGLESLVCPECGADLRPRQQ